MPGRAPACYNFSGFLELVFAAISANYTPGTPSTPTLHGGGCVGAAAGPWELPGSRELKASPSRVPEAAAAASVGRAAAGSAQVKSWMRGWEKKKAPLVSV